jgi:hypothetical protein
VRHEIFNNAVGAVMVVEASDEQHAQNMATQAFEEALERAVVQDAYGDHPGVIVEEVNPHTGPS